jgi:hypothetical protein
LRSFDDPQFSSNGRYVYFTTPAWTTSPAVQVVDTTNAKERFVCPGGSLEVLRSGEYRDCLLVRQHCYLLGGDSFDSFWLLRLNGNEQLQRALFKALAGAGAAQSYATAPLRLPQGVTALTRVRAFGNLPDALVSPARPPARRSPREITIQIGH